MSRSVQACWYRGRTAASAAARDRRAGESPFQRWISRLRRIWSASRTARRASSPLTLGRERPRAALTKSASSSARGSRGSGSTLSTRKNLAEEMLAHRGWLAQVDAVQVELAAFELFGRANQRGLPWPRSRARRILPHPRCAFCESACSWPGWQSGWRRCRLQIRSGHWRRLHGRRRGSRRPPRPNVPAHRQREQQVEVVDHQVEHDADISRAERVGGKPFGIDELGADRPAVRERAGPG